MIENLPLYIVITFIVITLITVGLFQNAFKHAAYNSRTANFLNFILPFWLFLQGVLGVTGFYHMTETSPSRVVFFGVLPALVFIVGLFAFSKEVIERLSMKTLIFLSVIRIPVELVLFWLYKNGQISQVLTLEGRNFDVLSGISAPIVAWLAFRNRQRNKPILFVWNLASLILLVNISVIAILSSQSPSQQWALEPQNRAFYYFPFVWLQTTIVPIVLFSHFAIFYQLVFKKK